MNTNDKIKKIQKDITINNGFSFALTSVDLLIAYQAITQTPDSLGNVILTFVYAILITKNVKDKERLLKRLEELLKIQENERRLAELENKDDENSLKLK